MAKVSAASSAENLGPLHPETVVGLSDDILFRDRLEVPAKAVGYPLTVEVIVQAPGQRGSTQRAVTVHH